MADTPPGSPQVQPPGGPGAYSRRTDSGTPAQPLRTPTGMPYGKQKQLEQAERSVALPNLTRQGGMPGGSTPGTPATQAPGPGGPSPASGTTGGNDILSLLSHPTQRPNEPLTAGLGTPQPTNVRQLLNQLATQPGAPDSVKRLAAEAMSGR